MRKIRYAITLVTLLVSLTGFTLGLGSGSLATLASNQHVTASAAGPSSHSVALLRKDICPGTGSNDC